MGNYLSIIIEYFMNSLEEFASAVKFPTANYTKKAFFVSLLFLAGVIVLNVFNMKTIVSWDSAAVCSILLCVVALIDSSTRSSAKKTAVKLGSDIKEKTSKLKSAIVKNNVVNFGTKEVQGYDENPIDDSTYGESEFDVLYESEEVYEEIDENNQEV